MLILKAAPDKAIPATQPDGRYRSVGQVEEKHGPGESSFKDFFLRYLERHGSRVKSRISLRQVSPSYSREVFKSYSSAAVGDLCCLGPMTCWAAG